MLKSIRIADYDNYYMYPKNKLIENYLADSIKFLIVLNLYFSCTNDLTESHFEILANEASFYKMLKRLKYRGLRHNRAM